MSVLVLLKLETEVVISETQLLVLKQVVGVISQGYFASTETCMESKKE